jgi:hypothetical protein
MKKFSLYKIQGLSLLLSPPYDVPSAAGQHIGAVIRPVLCLKNLEIYFSRDLSRVFSSYAKNLEFSFLSFFGVNFTIFL